MVHRCVEVGLLAEGSTVGLVVRERKYRSLAITLWLLGVGMSLGMPYVTLFLTKEVGVSASKAGAFFLTALMGPVVSLVTGRLSDRMKSRLPLLAGSVVWLGFGWWLLGFARSFVGVMLIGLAFFAVIGTVNSQAFALARDHAATDLQVGHSSIISTLRAAYSIGWVCGPVVSGWLAATMGYRWVFRFAAMCYIAALIPLKWVGSCERAVTETRNGSGVPTCRLVVFSALAALVASGDVIKAAFLPLHVVDGLGSSPYVLGGLFSIGAALEIIAMPLVGRLGDRFGAGRVMAWAMVIAALNYTWLALAKNIQVMYVIQSVHAFVFAAMAGLGVAYAQSLAGAAVGLGSAVYFAGQSLAGPVGSMMGSYGVSVVGIPAVFFLPAGICGLAAVVMGVWGVRWPVALGFAGRASGQVRIGRGR